MREGVAQQTCSCVSPAFLNSGQTDGQGATLNAAHSEGRILKIFRVVAAAARWIEELIRRVKTSC